MTERPKTLIEEWFPIETVGCESMRERGASSALPPLYFLHVWWARRPLLASRAAMLASVLPAWSDQLARFARENGYFRSQEQYHAWFAELCGIYGDPVAARALLARAREAGKRIANPYTHDRAFTVNPAPENLAVFQSLLSWAWGKRKLTVLDPFAGGGSIPFEAIRYGFDTRASELNPVAGAILRGTLDYPFAFGPALRHDVRKYGFRLVRVLQEQLRPFQSTVEDETRVVGLAYLWARTVRCPYSGKPLPLAPNWWLERSGSTGIAAKPIFDAHARMARFEIVKIDGPRPDAFDPNHGTVRRGIGRSPWESNQAVDGDYIKAEAQAGRMGSQLYCIAVKKPRGGFEFREPTDADLRAVEKAEEELARRLPDWEARGWVPTEAIPAGNKTDEPRRYGMPTWADMFSPRQLLTLCSYVEALHDLIPEIEKELPADRAKAVVTYLGMVLSKAVNYNSYLASWDGTRRKIRGVFDRHDYAFKWTYGEFDASRNLFPWALKQITDAYKGIGKLAAPAHNIFKRSKAAVPVEVTLSSASDLDHLKDGSVDLVLTDPPYYDNVMYSELSDFFYVWLKRTIGTVHPDLFADDLANKDDEAVANPARFARLGRKKKQLASGDYERKMAAAFREAFRVLTDDGVLTVMFTHKKVEAWDTLATSLLDAGFAIHSSWPVHTESEHSLHQANKNAARSTIMLTCRKRFAGSEPAWWDDIRGRVRRTARETAESLQEQGISGVDLYIATFGPTLAILSENWPVLTSEYDEKTGEPKALRPDVALDLARAEVVELRKHGLLGRDTRFDPVTDWYLMAWDAFKAGEFPADEARKLALALGLDLERDIITANRLLKKKGAGVELLPPSGRRGRGRVDPDSDAFDLWIDAAHTAMLLYDEEGPQATEMFLRRSQLLQDPTFTSLLQALVNAIPRAKKNGKLIRPEARSLDGLRLAFFAEIEAPPDPEPIVEQGDLRLRG